MSNLYQLLQQIIEKGASDLHITAGSPPQMRVNGHLVPMNYPVLGPAETKQLIYSVLTDAQKHRYEEENELDLSFGLKGLSRFRANVFTQRGAAAAAIRVIPVQTKTIEELGLPPVVGELLKRPRGLILVTGPTGSGKSTTLASMIDRINTERHDHIITIEDPIEFLHQHKSSLVNQREVTSDTKTFKAALKYILRQDPDVVLIGEMRDLETIEAALTIAETGHLTMATLHTNSCAQTINRIVDVFPPHQQPQVRAQLSFVLEGVLSQQLVPKLNGESRVMAMEVMVPNPAIRNLIREDKVHQIYSTMQTGQNKFGMQTMNQSLHELYTKRLISYDEALTRSSVPEELLSMMDRGAAPPGARRVGAVR